MIVLRILILVVCWALPVYYILGWIFLLCSYLKHRRPLSPECVFLTPLVWYPLCRDCPYGPFRRREDAVIPEEELTDWARQNGMLTPREPEWEPPEGEWVLGPDFRLRFVPARHQVLQLVNWRREGF